MVDGSLEAQLRVDPGFTVGPVRKELFGSFVEHLGRCVYGGIYEPGHPAADGDGFRTDVMDLVGELGVSDIRYPGGNFVSGYRWEDGIGAPGQRPRRLDLAWHSLETNEFGLDEFARWARRTRTDPVMAVNLGTRGAQEALDLLEYCNVSSGTRLSDQRRSNGAEAPYRIRTWCLGNEMDGPWQIGHRPPQEYGALAARTARAMRMIDPDLRLVVCGSSNSAMATFGTWESAVLAEAYDAVDAVSAHQYYAMEGGDLASFLASGVDMDRMIERLVAVIDAAGVARGSRRRLDIAFDEWNVWYQDRAESRVPEGDDWPVAPRLLEDRYTVADAVVVGDLLITLLRHADRVASANLAQLVNVIAPIVAEPGGPAWRQTIFHPFAATSRAARGEVLRTVVRVPTIPTPRYGDVPAVDAVATWEEKTGALAVLLVNRSVDDEASVRVGLNAFGDRMPTAVSAVSVGGRDLDRTASADADTGRPWANRSAQADGEGVAVALPPASWSLVELRM
ncbi:alpha-N-arabinofuranosidase [Schaalia naturae]|uniref:non-reducing end alpha-L-arabinofuranosidase n=1 Tax=Schaalia naturae TaxID=635203 RepID=A0ABW2SIS0_9ACTO